MSLAIIFSLCCGSADAKASGAEKEVFSAVPPVAVLHDAKGDYVLDAPFPQWVKEPAPQKLPAVSQCSDSAAIPDWADPPPAGGEQCAASNADGSELWVATAAGLIFLDLKNKQRLFFAGRRWLPDDDVWSVGVTPAGDALAHTSKGAVLIARRRMTLDEKARYFEGVVRKRHDRDGMIADTALKTPGDPSSFQLADDDNDGQWTEMYLAAESFRYAVTRDPEALRNARKSFLAMKRLLTVSPVKGYVARSVLSADKCPGKDPERWRMSPSGGFCWKSDTSKDELIGHYFGLPIYYDLVADAAEKKTIRVLIRDLTDYIVDHGFRLLDENGKVTTYGNLDPEWINGPFGRMGDQGLNSVAALGLVRSAYNITGDAKYLDAYRRLIADHHYEKNALREKEISDRFQVNHDSDEMAALAFYTLLRAENADMKLRDDFYLEGMRRLWRNDLPERNPEQIIIYGAFAGADFRLDLAVRTLREIPLDLLEWGVRNEGRADIAVSQTLDRFGRRQSVFALPYTEARTMRWSENMYRLDVEGGGWSERVPTFWLLPYWMARYHAMIRPAPK